MKRLAFDLNFIKVGGFLFKDPTASYDFNDYDEDPMPRDSDPNNWLVVFDYDWFHCI